MSSSFVVCLMMPRAGIMGFASRKYAMSSGGSMYRAVGPGFSVSSRVPVPAWQLSSTTSRLTPAGTLLNRSRRWSSLIMPAVA